MENQTMMRKRAQNLRKNMTKEENQLWYQFLKTYPIQFRRQYQIGCYIVDFYCYKAKLVIEVDGSQHYEPSAIEYDRIRTDFLSRQGILVIRFSNLDLNRDFRAVCDHIDRTVRNRIKE